MDACSEEAVAERLGEAVRLRRAQWDGARRGSTEMLWGSSCRSQHGRDSALEAVWTCPFSVSGSMTQ